MSRLPLEPLVKRLRATLRLASATVRAALGLGDYEAYLRHRRAHHPGAPTLTREEFFRLRQDARYRRGATRCC